MPTEYKLIGADGREYPGTLEEMREWARDGRLGSESLVWCSEEARWIRASQRPELQWDLPRPVEPPPILPEPEPLPPVAGFIPRLAAFVFDTLVLQVLFFLMILPWRESLGEILELAAKQYDFTSNVTPDVVPVLKAQGILLLIYMPLSLLYWVGFNGRYGATPGKFLVGLRIVDLQGDPIGYRRAFRRYCAEAVSILPFFLGYVLIAISPTKQGLHDLLAGTRVVFHRAGNA